MTFHNHSLWKAANTFRVISFGSYHRLICNNLIIKTSHSTKSLDFELARYYILCIKFKFYSNIKIFFLDQCCMLLICARLVYRSVPVKIFPGVK